MRSNLFIYFICIIFSLGTSCTKTAAIDGGSVEDYSRSAYILTSNLPLDQRAEVYFALTKIQKSAYTAEELNQLVEVPVSAEFLELVDGKTLSEILEIADAMPDRVPEIPTPEELAER